MKESPNLNEIHFFPPEEVYKEREKYAVLISKVLEGCYGKDYPGTSLKADKNLQALTERTQRSVIWAITDEDLYSEKVGTSSMVDAADEFGLGFAEMGKSGSLGDGGAKLGYMKFLSEWEDQNPFLEGFDSLVTTVRNCSERKGKEQLIKSGIGIRVIFLKYLKFQQWGIAPWLLMPDDSDGSYEVLDLLFRFRDTDKVAQYFKENKIYLISDKYKYLLNNFLNYNLGIKAEFDFSYEQEKKDLAGWNVITASDKKDKNPVKLVPANNSKTFEESYLEMDKEEGAMKAVYLPLVSSTCHLQEELEYKGWVLTGFIPGRIKDGQTLHVQGMWSKLETDRPLISPHYLNKKDSFSPDWYYEFVENTMNSLSKY